MSHHLMFSLVQHPSSFVHGVLTKLCPSHTPKARIFPQLAPALSLSSLWHQQAWNLGFYFFMQENLAVSDKADHCDH